MVRKGITLVDLKVATELLVLLEVDPHVAEVGLEVCGGVTYHGNVYSVGGQHFTHHLAQSTEHLSTQDS